MTGGRRRVDFMQQTLTKVRPLRDQMTWRVGRFRRACAGAIGLMQSPNPARVSGAVSTMTDKTRVRGHVQGNVPPPRGRRGNHHGELPGRAVRFHCHVCGLAVRPATAVHVQHGPQFEFLAGGGQHHPPRRPHAGSGKPGAGRPVRAHQGPVRRRPLGTRSARCPDPQGRCGLADRRRSRCASPSRTTPWWWSKWWRAQVGDDGSPLLYHSGAYGQPVPLDYEI